MVEYCPCCGYEIVPEQKYCSNCLIYLVEVV